MEHEVSLEDAGYGGMQEGRRQAMGREAEPVLEVWEFGQAKEDWTLPRVGRSLSNCTLSEVLGFPEEGNIPDPPPAGVGAGPLTGLMKV